MNWLNRYALQNMTNGGTASSGLEGTSDDYIQNLGNIYKVELTDQQFKTLSTFLQKETGIKLPDIKRTMLQSRLHKRLRALNMKSFTDYIKYAMAKGNEQEIINMIDVVSTNKTDFFREASHFNFLTCEYLPHLLKGYPNKNINIWSSASSSGEEPYTIAIVLQELMEKYHRLTYNILATDISTQMLEKGRTGIYHEERIANIPVAIKKKYFLRSKDRESKNVKVTSELRSKINWQRLNLMDSYYGSVKGSFDIIFCRNVLIYFEREIQESVINKLCRHIPTGGLFILGHSESIINMNVPLVQVKPTIYKKV